MAENRTGVACGILLTLFASGCGGDGGNLPAAVAAPVERDVPYVPTPQPVVERMLEMAGVTSEDVVYDLGSGDGRIVITAAQQYGARGVGIDIDPQRIAEANENARRTGVTDRVEFIQGDLFKTDLRPASVVTLYLLYTVNLRLRPKLLAELRPGTPVVSHDFSMGDWEADAAESMGNDDIYLWIVPAKVEGTWVWDDGSTMTISQDFQKISIDTELGPVTQATLRGDEIAFTIQEMRGGRNVERRVEARIARDAMAGTARVGGASPSAWTARRER
ncbi:MAG: SAM-dependent methyltransferase [Thermoanaerobaculia bacterium]